jgi:glutamate-ammonia-ligase adenylyltransferase
LRLSWKSLLRSCADPERVRQAWERLAALEFPGKPRQLSNEQARALLPLLSGSQVAANLLAKHPDWLTGLQPELLQFPRRRQGLRQELNSLLLPRLDASDYSGALAPLRQFKQREMLRIAARDLARLGHVSQITQEISDVADVCLEAVWQICYRRLTERHGHPFHLDAEGHWQPTTACIIGLGKLGGQELNYSSDVDVIFLYGEEGQLFKKPPSGRNAVKTGLARRNEVQAGPLHNHQFFNRLAEAFIAEVTRLAPEGMLYRIDLRLRPEGEAGPLSRSLAGYENYYAQWGQTWERMMLIKARGVAGNMPLAAEFLEIIQPFRYPRSISEGVLREIAAMKERIENEVVKAGELERNVKLGPGGIREIEFIAQALQLLHAGRQPFLQGPQTLVCLEKLAQYQLMSEADCRLLADAYGFLREVEHRLQMENNLQTHTIPTNHPAQDRLARLMGFPTCRQFETAHHVHRRGVRQIFDRLLKPQEAETRRPMPFPRGFEGREADWQRLLTEFGFLDVPQAFRVLREFVEGPGYVHVSPRTSELAYELLPKFFDLCPRRARPSTLDPRPSKLKTQDSDQFVLSDPDRVITRLDNFIAAYGARATLFELWQGNAAIFELLLRLFDRSEFLAELAIGNPDLVDELVTSGRLRQRKSAADTLRDLRHGAHDDDQFLWLRRYHQAELMRIGLRDILGLADFEQHLAELSALAEAELHYALHVVMLRHKIKSPPFVIIGLGKLGGGEIDYGSDLDIIFVARSQAANLQELSRLAVEVMELLSRRTEQGLAFHTDTRLRPDGEKGALVNTLSATEEYYRRRAQLWEIQTLTRARPVAGDVQLGDQFKSLAERLTNFNEPNLPLAAYGPDWRRQIHQMRVRIEKERTPRGQQDLAIKTGAGGLMDAEFIAQTLCLEHGWQEPNTLRALERGQAPRALPEAGKLIENYRRLRRVEGVLRRWSYEGESVLPVDPAPYLRVAVRCGFSTPESFRKAIAGWRQGIRRVYAKVFGTSPG